MSIKLMAGAPDGTLTFEGTDSNFEKFEMQVIVDKIHLTGTKYFKRNINMEQLINFCKRSEDICLKNLYTESLVNYEEHTERYPTVSNYLKEIEESRSEMWKAERKMESLKKERNKELVKIYSEQMIQFQQNKGELNQETIHTFLEELVKDVSR